MFTYIKYTYLLLLTAITMHGQPLADTVAVSPKAILLDTVTISKNNYNGKEVLLGLLNKRSKILSSATIGHEIVLYIKNTGNAKAMVKSFSFKVKKWGEHQTAFRVHFYEKTAGSTVPGNEIILDDIVVYSNSKSKLVEIDVSQYNIELPADGLFAGVEWLGVTDADGKRIVEKDEERDSIKCNNAVDELLTFERNRFGNKPWHDTSYLKEVFADLMKFKNCPNASFGLKVVEFEE